MKRYKKSFLFIISLFLFYTELFGASLPLSIEGNHLIRLPGSSKYIEDKLTTVPDNIIIFVPEANNASNSILNLDGHSIKLYPGSVFKISKGFFMPMSGRFEFTSDETATNSINIIANNCNAGYSYGHFLIEATPDNGIFFAMKNNGSAWIKDLSRKVFELKQGQQVQVPLYGNSVIRSRVESFWGKEPSSFGNLGEVGQETAYGIVGKESALQKASRSLFEKKAKEEESEKISSDNELDEDNEDEDADDD